MFTAVASAVSDDSDDDAEVVEFVALPGGGGANKPAPAPKPARRDIREIKQEQAAAAAAAAAASNGAAAADAGAGDAAAVANDAGGGGAADAAAEEAPAAAPAAPVLHTRSGRATKSRTFYDDASASAAEVAAYIAEHPGTLPSEAAAALAAIKDPPRPKRSAAAAAAAGLAKAPEHSVWVQCDECAKWRLVRTEAAPGEGQRWVCSMNADARHNSCAAAQHLHERAAPEDGERVEPMGYKSREQLADDLRPCTAAQREYLLDRLPRSMGEHGWVARPVAGSFTTHRCM